MHKLVVVIFVTLVTLFSFDSSEAATIKQPSVDLVAGLVLYRSDNGAIEYVLLQKKSELDDWSVPKGKADEGEDVAQAAIRETFEETSYLEEDYEPFFNKTLYFEYTTNDDILKKVTVFPAKLTNVEKPVEIDPKEHNAFQWLEFTAALRIVKKQYKEAFIAADAFIQTFEAT